MIIFIAFLIFSLLSWTRRLSIRIGYFADKITEDTFNVNRISQVNVDTKNCITYLLEGDNQDEIKIFISADRSTDIQNSLSGSILNVDVQSEVRTVQ